MKKQNLTKKTILLLAICLISRVTLAQVPWAAKNWAMPGNDFNTTSSAPTNSSIGYGPSPSSGNPYTSSAGAYDGSGNLKFIVSDLTVYYSGGSFNLPTYASGGTTYNSPGHEVDIVPVPGTSDCSKYYVIYELAPQSGGGSAVAYIMVDCSSGTPVKTVPSNNILIGTTTGNGIAVSSLATGTRYLFTMDWNSGLQRFTIGSWSGTTGIGSQTTLSALTGTILANSDDICQMEISPDQKRLAWNSHINTNFVYEAILTSSYGYSSVNTYTISGASQIYGLQYSQPTYTTSASRLFVGTDVGITYFTPGSSPTYHSLTSTSNYGTTQLGRMATGNIMGLYTGGATPAKLFEINVATPSIAMSLNTTQVFSNATVHNSLKSVYHIPDGLDNNRFANAGIDQINQQDVCGSWSPGVTIGTPSVSATYTWSPGTNLSSTSSATATSTYSTTSTFSTIAYTETVTATGCTTETSVVHVTAIKTSCPTCCREMNPNLGNSAEPNFNVFPNPTSNVVNITLYDQAEYIRILDLSGKILFESKDLMAKDVKIDVSKFAKGIYFIIAKMGDKLEKQKVLIE